MNEWKSWRTNVLLGKFYLDFKNVLKAVKNYTEYSKYMKNLYWLRKK